MLYMLLQWGASPLEDNLPTDDYHYQLSVTTGMKKNGGTASNISFIISGETCDTGVRRLFDGKRKVCLNHIGGSICILVLIIYSKTCLKRPIKNIHNKIFRMNGSLMKVESIAECGNRS